MRAAGFDQQRNIDKADLGSPHDGLTTKLDFMRHGIALGSNLGDRLHHLQRGVQEVLRRVPGAKLRACAPIYETAPVDCPDGSQAFLNSVIEIETDCDTHSLHRVLVEVEQLLGRPAVRDRHAPRPLDLDVLYSDDIVIHDAVLQVPHPRLHLRRFVLQPLADIRPDLMLPGHSACVRDLLSQLQDDPSAVKQLRGASLVEGEPSCE